MNGKVGVERFKGYNVALVRDQDVRRLQENLSESRGFEKNPTG